MKQHGGHRRVDAAREAQHDFIVAQFLAQLAHGSLDEALRSPALSASADADHEILQQLRAVGRMVDLGMELDAPRLLALDTERRHAHVLRPGDQTITGRHRRDGVAVRHPHLRPGRQSGHQRIGGIAHRQHGAAVFAAGCRLHLAAVGRREVLCPVADAQQRQPPLDLPQIGIRGPGIAHRKRAARENHAPHRRIERRNLVERVNLAIDIQFAYAPCDELRILRPEVEDKDLFHL